LISSLIFIKILSAFLLKPQVWFFSV